jgi:hypothetical protein
MKQLISIRRSRTEPCGCVVTEAPGHTHTKLCPAHAVEYIEVRVKYQAPDSNLDLIGG